MQKKRLMIIGLFSLILMLVPLVAMQFTDEVNWNLFDFVVAGILLIGTGVMIELILRKIKQTKYRIAFILVLMVLFFLIWAEIAVGIFGIPLSGQ